MRILDTGSGNTCQNKFSCVTHMIDEIAKVDSKRKFILKWQLFKEAGNNIPLDHDIFKYAFGYAAKLGYKTTASVFDKESLDFLLQFNISFVKIANRPDLYYLIGEIPRKINVIVSTDNAKQANGFAWTPILDYMCCISKYPALIEDYKLAFPEKDLKRGISDHTTNWDLYLKYKPEIYEFHFKLQDSTGLDAGPFARTPEQIKEIYEEL